MQNTSWKDLWSIFLFGQLVFSAIDIFEDKQNVITMDANIFSEVKITSIKDYHCQDFPLYFVIDTLNQNCNPLQSHYS